MMTPTEKRILQKRKSAATGAILVPILEELLTNEVEPEDEEDFNFLDMLLRVRSTPRSSGVFSPSMLGSCMRQAWFAKRGEEKHKAQSASTNGYFLKGNFTHFQWQFAMWKAARAGMLELVMVVNELHGTLGDGSEWDVEYARPGVEVRVIDGDFGGTIDILPKIDNEVFVVDFKGINLVEFQRTVKNGVKIDYQRQIVGYAKIANKILDLDISRCLLVAECKAGPLQNGSPIALHETIVSVADHVGDVNRRLKTLRYFDHVGKRPEAECVSTYHMGFQECPFNRFCYDEVREVQRERERIARAKPIKVVKPSRPNRA